MTNTDILVIAELAVSNGVVGAALFQVYKTTENKLFMTMFQIPNQPIVYADDPEQRRRSEDSSIAWTWSATLLLSPSTLPLSRHHFLEDPASDPEILLRLPMTKAGVKALDTVENFLTSATAPPEVADLGLAPTHHIVAGASKRGWTTWTVGAVDTRWAGATGVEGETRTGIVAVEAGTKIEEDMGDGTGLVHQGNGHGARGHGRAQLPGEHQAPLPSSGRSAPHSCWCHRHSPRLVLRPRRLLVSEPDHAVLQSKDAGHRCSLTSTFSRQTMFDIVDPFVHRDKLILPKVKPPTP